jgi:AcrR family transcriptional regulator
MSPRPYQLGQRQAAVDETRRRVLDAARALLVEATHYAAFTVDAVAKTADVARATVYYQFGSKTGLLEALCDDVAVRAHLLEVAAAFTDPDPRSGLDRFIASFGRFWASEPTLLRRLRALAALDPDVADVIAARDNRRREGIEILIGNAAESRDTPARRQLADVLYTLTSFETFASLAGSKSLSTATPLVQRLAHDALDSLIEDAPTRNAPQVHTSGDE